MLILIFSSVYDYFRTDLLQISVNSSLHKLFVFALSLEHLLSKGFILFHFLLELSFVRQHRKALPLKYYNKMDKQDFSQFEIQGYNIVKEIGKGEFGKVYLAKDQNGIEVAIKTIKKSDLRKSSKRQKLFET